MIDTLLTRGGMSSMLWTINLILCAMCFGGVMEKSGMLEALAEAILKKMDDDKYDEMNKILKLVEEDKENKEFQSKLEELEEVVEQISPRAVRTKESRAKELCKLIELKRQSLERDGLPDFLSHDMIQRYRKWSKSQKWENLPNANEIKKRNKTEKMEKMLKLLLKKRTNERLTKSQWKIQSEDILDIPARTFDRYYDLLRDRIEIANSGRIRIKENAPEK
jgi:hypothetical protein